jgi:hypothetical protein
MSLTGGIGAARIQKLGGTPTAALREIWKGYWLLYILLASYKVLIYSSSTFFLAHGVFRKNVRLDLMLGSLVKQLIRMRLPNSSHPK